MREALKNLMQNNANIKFIVIYLIIFKGLFVNLLTDLMKSEYINSYILIADYNGICFIYIVSIVITILCLTVCIYRFKRLTKNYSWSNVFITTWLFAHL